VDSWNANKIQIQIKTTVVPVHAMKAYRGRNGTTPFILNLEGDEHLTGTHQPLYTGGKAPGTQ